MNKLTNRLFIILSIVTIIIMSIFVAVRYQSNESMMQKALQERSLGVANRVATSVQLTIWNIYQKTYDRHYTENFAGAILDAEMQSPFVRGIKILGNFGQLYSAKIKIGDYSVPFVAELHDKTWGNNTQKLRYPVRQGKMTIGHIEVIYSDMEFSEDLKKSLIIDITQVAIIGLLFVISLYLVLRRALVAPLQSLQLAHKALNSLDEAVFVINEAGLLLDINPSYSRMTHYSLNDVKNQSPSLYASEHPNLSIIELISLDTNNNSQWSGEVVCQCLGDTKFRGWLNVHKVVSKDSLIHYVAVLNNIEEKLQAQHNLHQLAYFDSLTKVPNRYSFMQNIDHELALAAQSNHQLALLYIDLDNFKWINDSYGHQIGDKLLMELTQRFTKQLISDDQLFRIGGDEFTIVIKNFASIKTLTQYANDIVTSAAQELLVDEHILHTSVSVGIAIYPQHSQNSQTLIRLADIAMFQAKQLGRNQVCVFCEAIEDRRVHDQIIANELKNALINEELALYFQPKIDFKNKNFQVHSAEALLRWYRDGSVYSTPDQFIAVAEQSSLIREIGYWVIKSACAQLQELRLQGVKNFSIAINLSPKQLNDDKLFDYLRSTMQEYKIQTGQLEVEITESAVIEDIQSSINTLNQLRSLGVCIAMDDFGTGYSSLSYLKQLPIDILKIDRSFINKSPYEPDDIAIVTAIFSMAKALGIKVVAEGIETQQQLNFLIANNCHYGQGFYFSKALTSKQFIHYIKQPLQHRDSLSSSKSLAIL